MRLTFREFELPLRHVFTISRSSTRTIRTLIVELEHDGLRGFGEAGEDAFYGASIAKMEESLAALRPVIESRPPCEPAELWAELAPKFGGNTFAQCLRSILRQDPDRIFVGEIRDLETAEIAVQASLTGHLVFSTLHTNDAPSAVTRLQDMGVKPYLVASAVQAVMAQRLVRCICAECKEERKPTERELKMLGEASASSLAGATLWRGRGCPRCSLTGYKGRKGIFEIFGMTDAIQRMIFDQRPANELRIAAREAGMRTLREDGLLKVASGMTSLEEVLRATMGDAN